MSPQSRVMTEEEKEDKVLNTQDKKVFNWWM